MKKLGLILLITILSVVNASALQVGVGKGQILTLPKPAAHVFVADPDIADIDVRSPNYIYIYGVKAGETSIDALDANNNKIMQIDVTVTQNFTNVGRILKEVLPTSTIKFTSVDRGLIMQGDVDTPEDAKKAYEIASATLSDGVKLVNMLKIRGSDQVMLRVRIAEVSRSELKNFGINLANIFTRGSFQIGLLTGRVFNDPVTGDFIRNGNNISIAGSPGRFDLSGVIDALENKGLVKILAEPNLTAKSGESANFLAGGEFPIPVPQENGAITIQYREFGVRLDFTPTVLSDDKINLKVAPEVSSLTTSTVNIATITVPAISTRRAATTVELGSGESFAIAGLMRNDVTNDISKFPWLGDVPVLGSLFRSNDFRTNETELVIIVTPYVVHGVKENDKLLTPTDGYVPPNDFERVLMGKTYSEASEPGRVPNTHKEGVIAKYKLNGDTGYILEE